CTRAPQPPAGPDKEVVRPRGRRLARQARAAPAHALRHRRHAERSRPGWTLRPRPVPDRRHLLPRARPRRAPPPPDRVAAARWLSHGRVERTGRRAADAGPRLPCPLHLPEGSLMDLSEYLGMFLAESREHLQNLNIAVIRIEESPEDRDTIDEIFRIAHSLKGMSGTMGFAQVGALTQTVEA